MDQIGRRTRRLLIAAAIAAIAATGAVSKSANATATGVGLRDTIVSNPAATKPLGTLGANRMASDGDIGVLLYLEQGTARVWARFHDAATGATSDVLLTSSDPSAEWAAASAVLTADGHLVVLAGGGPIHFKDYALSGSPLPTQATLVRHDVFGDAESRMGALTRLAGGGLAGVYHQHPGAGPSGYTLVYRAPGAPAPVTVAAPDFMPSWASKQVIAQQPGDGSVWVFSNADGWGAIGALRAVEDGSTLRVVSADGQFVSSRDGRFGSDPENPDLAIATDAASGRLVLAYQSADRRILSTSPVVTESRPALAWVDAAGAKSFVAAPEMVERVSRLGLAVRGGTAWLSYRPVDEATLTYTDLAVARYDGVGWVTQRLGATNSPYARQVTSGTSADVAVVMADGKLHWFTGTTATQQAPVASSTSTTTVSSTSTTTAAPKCRSKKCR